MEDSELNAIRAARLAQMQKSAGSTGVHSLGSRTTNLQGAGGNDDVERRQEMTKTMLRQILDQDAEERLNRIALVKPEKARGLEQLLIKLAQSGQLKSKVSESYLIDLLEQVNDQDKGTKIVINRKRYDDDDDDEDYGF
ncbi:DNA-binding TFAR19-related protein [Conidiobolus coronatus NRRL 28638]|uniref:DNA-binding TFAR19-related protein n=1 Tax=Conidiobolus coronatus (strain ATCC 28846 / CBS 209.66 / NRRL 28638) TaxID=796925 RepID=A0A137NUY8_CONC2|nr:DNA-binding TFAR19-related protein [Conidiobolus coronatus NRRL 28638]|eukprot:KXN66600.1 DNA-binding TFAR19-related protein [Conidiobolus coronatus NRRL 28638]